MAVNSVDNIANGNCVFYLSYSCQQLFKYTSSTLTKKYLFYQLVVKTMY